METHSVLTLACNVRLPQLGEKQSSCKVALRSRGRKKDRLHVKLPATDSVCTGPTCHPPISVKLQMRGCGHPFYAVPETDRQARGTA